ncbi:MAG TPA: MarR family transcriptional regulator [Chitinophagaceae bacterium]|nr:MarR family transcriptional regulator [Chitinophagaceae bacterium]
MLGIDTSESFYIYHTNDIGMGIDKDIHQNKFRNERHKAMINLLFTYGWTIEQLKQFVSEQGITHQQFNILRILRGNHPTPLSTLTIRERMIDKMSDTSRIVDRLLSKGLVRKVICKKDRRLVDITITDKGLKLLDKMDNMQDDMDAIFSNLSEKEASSLSKLLDKIRG